MNNLDLLDAVRISVKCFEYYKCGVIKVHNSSIIQTRKFTLLAQHALLQVEVKLI